MTGSSMDGIDAVILETDGVHSVKHITGETLDFIPGFRRALRAAEYALQQEQGNIEVASQNFSRHFSRFCSEDDIDIDDKLQEWEIFYNCHRPHSALKGKTPFEVLKLKLQA